jgi:hypothetical protein
VIFYLLLFSCASLFANNGGGSYFTELQGLCGTAYVSNQEFAYVFDSNVNDATFPPKTASNIVLKTLDLKWSGGVRGAFGYSSCDENETFKVEVTYLPNKITQKFCKPPRLKENSVNYLTPFWNSSFVGTTVDSVEVYSKINFLTVDFLAQTKICTLSQVAVNPYIGIRGLFLNKTFTSSFHEALYLGINESTTPLIQRSSKMSLFDRNHSGGITAGFGFKKELLCSFAFVGKVGGSLLVGALKVNECGEGGSVVSRAKGRSLLPTKFSFLEKNTIWTANLEGEMGFNYQFNLCRFKTDFGVSYLNSFWFDQNRLRHLIFSTNGVSQVSSLNYLNPLQSYGNLGIQAVAFKLALSF